MNKHHAYFLLVDNGTVGKYGAEIALRRKLEKFISTQSLSGSKGKNIDEYFSSFTNELFALSCRCLDDELQNAPQGTLLHVYTNPPFI